VKFLKTPPQKNTNQLQIMPALPGQPSTCSPVSASVRQQTSNPLLLATRLHLQSRPFLASNCPPCHRPRALASVATNSCPPSTANIAVHESPPPRHQLSLKLPSALRQFGSCFQVAFGAPKPSPRARNQQIQHPTFARARDRATRRERAGAHVRTIEKQALFNPVAPAPRSA
jgi:hypothetical protein